MAQKTRMAIKQQMKSFILLIFISILATCAKHNNKVADNAKTAETAAEQPGLTLEALQNAEYRSEYFKNGYVRLTNGKYESADVRIVISLADTVGFGDLNGDGIEDTVVVLVTNTGGSGVFYDLAVVINRNGIPKNVASAFLGDRVKIESISIEAQRVIVNMITQDANDPMCCPTLKVTKTYHLEGDTLVENNM